MQLAGRQHARLLSIIQQRGNLPETLPRCQTPSLNYATKFSTQVVHSDVSEYVYYRSVDDKAISRLTRRTAP